MEPEGSSPHSHMPDNCPYPEPVWTFCNVTCFYDEELLTPRPTPKQEDHSVSAVRDCLFNIFAATLHIGGRSSIRSLRMQHSVVTGTTLSRKKVSCNKNSGIQWYKAVFKCLKTCAKYCRTGTKRSNLLFDHRCRFGNLTHNFWLLCKWRRKKQH